MIALMCQVHVGGAERLRLNLHPWSVAVSGSGALIGFGKLPGDAAHCQPAVYLSLLVPCRTPLENAPFLPEMEGKLDAEPEWRSGGFKRGVIGFSEPGKEH